MIKVEFEIDGKKNTVMYDVDGWTISQCQQKIDGWVKEDYPDAVNIKIIESLQGIKSKTK